MEVSTNVWGHKAVVAASGEIDLSNLTKLEAAFRALDDTEVGEIVVDLREVTYLDSSVLRVLVAERHQTERMRVRLRLVPNDRVRSLLDVTRLDRAFELSDQP